MCSPGCVEWQAAHCRKSCAPRDGSPAATAVPLAAQRQVRYRHSSISVKPTGKIGAQRRRRRAVNALRWM